MKLIVAIIETIYIAKRLICPGHAFILGRFLRSRDSPSDLC